MENNAESKLPWKCNKYTWIGHWTVNMEDGQATQKQCKSNDASCGSNGEYAVCAWLYKQHIVQSNGAAAAMMLNESVELRLSWKLGRETVGCGLAGCATNTFKKIGEIKRIGERRPISQFWWKQGKSQRYQNQVIVKEGELNVICCCSNAHACCADISFLNCFGAKL